MLAGMLISAMPAQAQLKFGIKAGMNANSISLDDVKGNFTKENQNGFFVGPMAEFTVPIVGVGADIALMYDQKHASIDDQSETMHYISIPINIKYTLGLGSLAGIYVATGPQFSFNVGNNSIFDTIKDNVTGEAQDFELNKSMMYWNIGAGVKLLSHLQVGYNYSIALGSTGEFSVLSTAGKAVTGKLKNNSHQISVAYTF